MKNKKVFLGGTCNESTWRDFLIKQLQIDYFNPVVDDWTEDCMIEERKQREICDFVLYTITPKMTGVYSIAEVVDDSNKRPEKTVFCLLEHETATMTCTHAVDGNTHEIGKGSTGATHSVVNLNNHYCGNGLPLCEVQSFTFGQMKSLNQVGKMVERNGGKYFSNLNEVANYLNRG